MSNSIIRLENISKNFETQHVLNDVSIEISRNDFVVIMGENGAGKSTLINIMAFLEEATEGKYYLNGEDVTNVNTKKGSTRRCCHEHYYFSLNEFSMLCISSLNVLSTFMRCSICEQL